MEGCLARLPARASGGAARPEQARVVLETGAARPWASPSASSSCSYAATPRTTPSATSAPTCSAPTGTRTRPRAGCAPTPTARSRRRCSTSATSPASATCTPPSSASPAASHPAAPVGDVADLPRLVRRARLMLEANKERAIQSTTGDLRPRERMWVYRRDKSPCRRCGTPIEVAMLGDAGRERATYWCPTLPAAVRRLRMRSGGGRDHVAAPGAPGDAGGDGQPGRPPRSPRRRRPRATRRRAAGPCATHSEASSSEDASFWPRSISEM